MNEVQSAEHPLPGLEADNLLALLAALGLLRALELAQPGWRARMSWTDRPWRARLHLSQPATRAEVTRAAADGVASIARDYDAKGRKNVGEFTREDYRAYLLESRTNPVRGRLATALAVEFPPKRNGDLAAAPFVFQHGQGHQHFLSRLLQVTQGLVPKAAAPGKARSKGVDDASYMHDALFAPWKRGDQTDAFRWDPDEDQRYALRHGDPSAAGAARTVHGANRLAGVGLLSFPCYPRAADGLPTTPGVMRDANGMCFVWPIWTSPLPRHGIERLLSHPDVLRGRIDRLRALGVSDVLKARRVPNAKFMNVTRGVPSADQVD